MKISVIGCGYLGAVHAASMAELGHEVGGGGVDGALGAVTAAAVGERGQEVVGAASNEPKVAALRAARAPFYEPGFEELLARTLATGRPSSTTDVPAAARAAAHRV